MGFERKKIMVLVFEDPDLEGLEIKARSVSAGTALAAARGLEGGAGIADVDRMLRALAGCPPECGSGHDELPPGQEHYLNRLVSWNLEEDGMPVPLDYAGLLSLDLDFVKTIAETWLDSAVGTPGDLGKDSTAGGPPGEVSIPMETLSPDLLS